MAEKVLGTRGERVAISYKMPPNIYEKVNKLVYEEKKFSTALIASRKLLLSSLIITTIWDSSKTSLKTICPQRGS